MALTERLALLVSLNPTQAITGLDAIGKAADRNLAKAEVGLTRTGHQLQKFGVAAGVAGGLAAYGLWKAGKAASDLNEATQKSRVVFGKASAEVEKFAESAAKIGLSKRAAVDAAGSFGNLFTSMGLGRAVAADMSVQITKLASDLASFQNTSPQDAIEALTSGLTGQARPLHRYGVLLDDATLKQKAYALGLRDTTTGVLPPAIRAQAAYALIFDQTKNAQGDYARTAGEVANSQRTLAANFENLKSGIGDGVLPVMRTLLVHTNDMIGGLSRLNAISDGTIGKLAAFSSVSLLAAGGLSFMAGKAILLRASIAALPSRLSALTGGLGGLAKAGALVAVGVGMYEFGQWIKNVTEQKVNVDALAASLGHLSAAGEESLKRSLLGADGIGKLDDIVREMSLTNVEGARRLVELAAAAGVSEKRIAALRHILNKAEGAANGAADGVGNLGAAADDAATPLDRLGKAIDEAMGPLNGLAAVDAAMSDFSGVRKYFEGVEEGVKDATERVRDARRTLQDLLNEPLDIGDQEKIAGKQRYLEFLMRKPAGARDEQWQHEVDITRKAIELAQADLTQAAKERENRIRDAREAVAKAEKDKQEAIAATSRTLEGNSDAAIKNRGMVIGAAKDVGDAIKTLAADGELSADDLATIDTLVSGFADNMKAQFKDGTGLIDSFAGALRKIPTGDLEVTLTVKPGDDLTKALLEQLLPAKGKGPGYPQQLPRGFIGPTLPGQYREGGGPVLHGTRAWGGRVTKSHPYVVGERKQPELFVPDQNGMVFPSTSSLGGVTLAPGAIVLNGVKDAQMPTSIARELRSLAWQAGLN